MADQADSVPIDTFETVAKAAAAQDKPGLKMLVVLFALFMLAVSDFFVENVVGVFRGGTVGREPTTFGHVIQGIFLILFYVLAAHLAEKGMI
jgi:small-conductance mechanosensitive channel